MTKICVLNRIFSIFLILFITTVSTQNLSPVLCGGLHSGVDPCKECSDNKTVLVKGQTLPKPLIVDTTSNQLKSRSNYGWKRGLKFLQNRPRVLNKRNRPPLRNSIVTEMKPTDFERPLQYVPQVQQVQLQVPNIDPNVKLAPRFHPIGDLCFKKGSKPEPASRLAEQVVITPAEQPKIECFTESSPVMPLGSSTILNTMIRNQKISDESTYQVPQLSSGHSRTKFRLQSPGRYNFKPRSGPIGINRIPNVNFANSDVRMRDFTVDLSVQSPNRIETNRLKPNVMRSGVIMDNTMNRDFNVYSGNSAIGVAPIINRDFNVYSGNSAIGVAPIINRVQKIPYLSPARPPTFESNVKSFSGNRNRGFISVGGKQNSGVPLIAPKRIHPEESVSSTSSMESPADLVSVATMYKKFMELYKQAADNVGGIDSIPSTRISEEKLSYGPQRTPINDQVEVTFKEVPEEKLHIVEKPVIELNLDIPSPTSRNFEVQPQPISYGDLGFKEKEFNSPKFQNKPVVFEAPVNNPEQRIDAGKGPDYWLRYPAPETIVAGELVANKPASLGYMPNNSPFTSNVVGNFVQQRISPVPSNHQNVNESPQLRSYSIPNGNVGQLSNKHRISSPSNEEICFCV